MDDEEIQEEKRKREVLATAGCGYGQAKKRVLHAFETRMWPVLAEGGWTKLAGTNENVGATYYMPPGVQLAGKYARNKEYTERVKDVIDRILERRNPLESKAADAYLDEVGDLVRAKQRPVEPRPSSRRRRRRRPSEQEPAYGGDDEEEIIEEDHHVSLSWKFNDRRHFPKLSSRVGRQYQVSCFPAAGSESSSAEMDDAHCYDQVFDPKKANDAAKIDFVHTTGNIPTKLKEAAMVALHQRDYITDGGGFDDDLKTAKPLDGSDWTDAEKGIFREAIFEHRKDFRKVAEKLGKSICNVYTYYLGTYKQSDDYRLLKVVCNQEAKEKEADILDDDICQICKEGGHLLICDGCDLSYHITCLRPPLKEVPEGEWICDLCLDEKLLDARDMILKQSSMLQPTSSDSGNAQKKETASNNGAEAGEKVGNQDGGKASGLAEVSGEDTSKSTGKEKSDKSPQVYSDEVMEATARFAEAFRKALATV